MQIIHTITPTCNAFHSHSTTTFSQASILTINAGNKTDYHPPQDHDQVVSSPVAHARFICPMRDNIYLDRGWSVSFLPFQIPASVCGLKTEAEIVTFAVEGPFRSVRDAEDTVRRLRLCCFVRVCAVYVSMYVCACMHPCMYVVRT